MVSIPYHIFLQQDFIEDVKGVMRVLFMFIPLPMFWALFDQQGSRWTLQAGTMNGELVSLNWIEIHRLNKLVVTCRDYQEHY